MKKVVVTFLLFMYMNCYLGCVKTVLNEYPVSDLKLVKDQSSNLFVINDSVMTELNSETCHVVNDSLIGLAKLIGSEEREIKFAINDIDKVALPEKKVTTTGYILGIALGVGGFVAVLYLVNKSEEGVDIQVDNPIDIDIPTIQ